jgi:hypothetical protein
MKDQRAEPKGARGVLTDHAGDDSQTADRNEATAAVVSGAGARQLDILLDLFQAMKRKLFKGGGEVQRGTDLFEMAQLDIVFTGRVPLAIFLHTKRQVHATLTTGEVF